MPNLQWYFYPRGRGGQGPTSSSHNGYSPDLPGNDYIHVSLKELQIRWESKENTANNKRA